MNKGILIGAVVVVLVLLVLVYASSKSVRKLREEGQFGSPVPTD